MAKTKISKVATDLNVSLATVFDFLRKRDINIDESPNTRVEQDVVDMLMHAFKSDVNLKKTSSEISSERSAGRARASEKPVREGAPKDTAPAEAAAGTTKAGPRILGHLELDANGRPIVKKAAPAPAPAEPDSRMTRIVRRRRRSCRSRSACTAAGSRGCSGSGSCGFSRTKARPRAGSRSCGSPCTRA